MSTTKAARFMAFEPEMTGILGALLALRLLLFGE
jgi:hypothetical protein